MAKTLEQWEAHFQKVAEQGGKSKAAHRANFAICETCEHRKKGGGCASCSPVCAAANDTPLTKLSDCPLGKWPKSTPDIPQDTERTPQTILLIVNGGLGDAVAVTYPAVALKTEGHSVAVWAMRGNARLMMPLWEKLGLEVIDNREAVTARQWDAIGCPCAAKTLAERAEGLDAKQLVTPRDHRKGLVDIAMDLARQLGVDKTPDAPLKEMVRELSRWTPDLVLVGAGVGRPPEAQRKRYPHWPEALGYLPRPVAFLGTEDAREPWMGHVTYSDDLTGTTPALTDLLPVLARGRLYVGVDNGLGHLAAAAGIPTISLFCHTDPARFAPYGKPNRVVDLRTGGDGVDDIARLVSEMFPQDNWAASQSPLVTCNGKRLAVILTAHNEGHQVGLTCDQVRAEAGCDVALTVVDEASTDGSCNHLGPDVRVIRRPEPTGVAPARQLGHELTDANAGLFLDAHMRVGRGTPAALLDKVTHDRCIVHAVMHPLYSGGWARQGCEMILHDGHIRSTYARNEASTQRYTRRPSFLAPGWAVSHDTFADMGGWARSLGGWGHTELFASASAFFADVPIYSDNEAHVWHLFRRRFPYHVSPSRERMNALVLARVLYDRHLFESWWKPNILAGLPGGVRVAWEETDAIVRDAVHFSVRRRSDDRAFFRECLKMDLDEMVGERMPKDGLFDDRYAAWWKEIQALGIRPEAMQDREELSNILRACDQIRPKTYLEIGTGRGGTTAFFSRIMGPGGRIVTTDLRADDARQEVRSRAFAYAKTNGVEVCPVIGDSRQPSTAAEVVKRLDGRPLDVLLIDGGHMRSTALADWELYGPMVRRGGIVLFHDITRQQARYGVYDVWRDLARQFDRAYDVRRHKHNYGMGVFQIP